MTTIEINQARNTLVGYEFRLPIRAEKGCIIDAEGTFVFPRNPALSMATAQKTAEEFCARVNRPTYAALEAGFCSAEG
jgi:hypothetical protein